MEDTLSIEIRAGCAPCFREEVKEGEPSLYNSCVINTCKEMTCYSDFPIPKDFPNFMSHRYFKRYLHLYADNFKLWQHISFLHSVQSVEKCPDFDVTGKWEIIAKDLQTGNIRKEVRKYWSVHRMFQLPNTKQITYSTYTPPLPQHNDKHDNNTNEQQTRTANNSKQTQQTTT